MIYFCCEERRRIAVLNHPTLNGIDFVEVSGDAHVLSVSFLKALTPDAIKAENIRIEGGERNRDIVIDGISIGAGAQAKVLAVKVIAPGDFSTYTLRLVASPSDDTPPPGMDPMLAAVDFSFKVECPTDFDCAPAPVCPPEPRDEPEINYLSKDYASFRQLMLDRMAALLPQWRERNPADVGIALVELLAYVGDQLSYQQDAIATEAYLGTARRRVSVRRHARLVDYSMHEGCNARAWVHLQVSSDTMLSKHAQIFTQLADTPKRIAPNSREYDLALAQTPVCFETMHDVALYLAHNQISFYTWGARDCCLPKGATRATLVGKLQNLKTGDVLILEEMRGAETGLPEDANPAHRHAVRLTRVAIEQDPLGGQFADPPNNQAVDVTEIEWSNDDALPFPLCLSTRVGEKELADISVARGNHVLADHGSRIANESLGTVPPPTLLSLPISASDHCESNARVPIQPRFRPILKNAPLTFVAPDDETGSARAALQSSPQNALPALELTSQLNAETRAWNPQRDLLSTAADARAFVVEVENNGAASLRFGDNQHGWRPDPGESFTANYRVGNGVSGNVGAESLAHIVSSDDAIVRARNPLAATGGVEPESSEDVRQRAPFAFRRQERAVTPEDYARVAERNAQVQRAAATFRWTGSWRTAFVTVDPLGGQPPSAAFRDDLARYLDGYRMAGHDVAVDAPRLVSLEIEMRVCVKPDYFRAQVKQALLEVFSNRVLADGRRGVFQPDNFTFGQPVYASALYAAAQGVAGVDSAQILKFQRQGSPIQDALDSGRLELGRLEIARLDNDPNFPERGVFRLTVEGGK